MVITTDDMRKAVEESKVIAENSKRAVQPPSSTPSPLDAKWQSVQRQRSRQQ